MKKLTRRVKKDIKRHMKRTHTKHGDLRSGMATLGVVTEEHFEVVNAIRKGNRKKVRAELLDLAIGAIRGVLAIDAETETRKDGAA